MLDNLNGEPVAKTKAGSLAYQNQPKRPSNNPAFHSLPPIGPTGPSMGDNKLPKPKNIVSGDDKNKLLNFRDQREKKPSQQQQQQQM